MLVTKLALACFAAASLAERPPGYTGNEQTTTESLLLGSFTKGVGGSIVAADACETIYALTCTEASNCDTGVTITATASPPAYRFYYTSNITSSGQQQAPQTAAFSQDCTLHGPVNTSTAICDIYQGMPHSSTSSSRMTLSGSKLVFANATITDGLSNLATTTGSSCTASAIAATKSIGGSADTVTVLEVYKILVPIGFVAVARALF